MYGVTGFDAHWHDENCNVVLRGVDIVSGTLSYFCLSHHQWTYKYPQDLNVTRIYKDGKMLTSHRKDREWHVIKELTDIDMEIDTGPLSLSEKGKFKEPE